MYYTSPPPALMHAPAIMHTPNNGRNSFYVGITPGPRGPGQGMHPGVHGQFYTPGLGLSRREREVWDVLMPALARAHVPPGPASAVAQAVLADSG